MAILTNCRFCNLQSINHDHDECAKKFGIAIESEILEHCKSSPRKLLPTKLQEKIESKEYKWYKEYLERQKKESTSESLRLKVLEVAESALEKIIDDNKGGILDNIRKRFPEAQGQFVIHFTTSVRMDRIIRY